MKKSLSLFVIAVAMTCQPLINGQTLFTENFDGFSDGTTAVPGLIFDPAMYSVQTDTTFGTDKVLQTSSTQQNIHGSFASTSVTDTTTLALHVNYRWTTAPTMVPQGNFLRMGLYNSGGTSASAHTDTVFLDDNGYLVDATYYASQFGYAAREENSISSAFTEILLDTLPATDMTQLGADQAKGADNGTDFDVLSLRISYDGSVTTTDIFFEDPTFSGAPALSRTDASSPISTFDSFFVRAAGSFGSANLNVEKITVSLTTVPEPKHYLLIVGSLLGLMTIRRRLAINAA